MVNTNHKSRNAQFFLKDGPFNGSTISISLTGPFDQVVVHRSVYQFPKDYDASNCSELVYTGEVEISEVAGEPN